MQLPTVRTRWSVAEVRWGTAAEVGWHQSHKHGWERHTQTHEEEKKTDQCKMTALHQGKRDNDALLNRIQHRKLLAYFRLVNYHATTGTKPTQITSSNTFYADHQEAYKYPFRTWHLTKRILIVDKLWSMQISNFWNANGGFPSLQTFLSNTLIMDEFLLLSSLATWL